MLVRPRWGTLKLYRNPSPTGWNEALNPVKVETDVLLLVVGEYFEEDLRRRNHGTWYQVLHEGVPMWVHGRDVNAVGEKF